jgi:YrhK-like protein
MSAASDSAPATGAADTVTIWIGVLFAIGSTCFLVGPLPGFVELVGSETDAAVFFAGSVFFTSAALLQMLHGGGGLDRWACVVQFAGTLFFNVSTFHALQTGLDANEYDRLVWRPDWRGSVCFLVSGVLAYLAVGGPSHRATDWRIAVVNLAGCVAFGISAVAGYVVPSTGSALDLAAGNAWTSFGALCFLVGALLLLPWRPRTERAG